MCPVKIPIPALLRRLREENVKAPDIIREATGGLASRPEGFVIWLTTQSNEPPAGVFREKLKYSRAVRDGRIDENQFLPVIYEFPQDMIKSGEARLVENFHLVNPNMGFSVDEAFLLQPEQGLPHRRDTFKRDPPPGLQLCA